MLEKLGIYLLKKWALTFISHLTQALTWNGSSVQSLSHVQFFAAPWTAACQASLSIANSQSLLKLTYIESVMPSNHLILWCPLLFLSSIFPSIRIFSSESVLHIRWPKYWSFSFSISPSNEYSRLISFRIDWFDLLAVQGTLKSLLQHPISKASILQHSDLTKKLKYKYFLKIFLHFINKLERKAHNGRKYVQHIYLTKSLCREHRRTLNK